MEKEKSLFIRFPTLISEFWIVAVYLICCLWKSLLFFVRVAFPFFKIS